MNKQSQQPKYFRDGKAVYGYLFSIPVKLPDGRQTFFFYQVEGYSKDHAYQRLRENKPQLKPSKIEFVDYLEPEHDVGYLGEKIPLFPYGVAGSQKLQ